MSSLRKFLPFFCASFQEFSVVFKPSAKVTGTPSFVRRLTRIIQSFGMGHYQSLHNLRRNPPHRRHVKWQPIVCSVNLAGVGVGIQKLQQKRIGTLEPDCAVQWHVAVLIWFVRQVRFVFQELVHQRPLLGFDGLEKLAVGFACVFRFGECHRDIDNNTLVPCNGDLWP